MSVSILSSVENWAKRLFSKSGKEPAPVDAIVETPPSNTSEPRAHWTKGLGNFFSGNSSQAKQPAPPPENPNISEERDSNEARFGNVSFVTSVENMIAPGIEEYISKRGKEFEERGQEDGSNFIDQGLIKDISRAYSTTLVDWIRSHSYGKLKSFENVRTVKKTIMEDEKERYDSAKEHLEEMTDKYHTEPKKFSKLLFRTYIFIAIFLIFADLPLAKMLTENGFNMVRDSWYALILTFGIAFFVIYIKIYYDEYVATPLGHFVKQFKKIPGLRRKKTQPTQDSGGAENVNTPDTSKDKDELFWVKIEYWVKFAVKTSILLLVLYTIFILGEFRFQNISNTERDALLKYVNWMKENTGADPKILTTHALEITKLAFRLITLVFPVIGGICLSLAMANLQNIKRLERAKAEYKEHQDLYTNALEEFSNADKSHADFKGIHDRWTEEGDDIHIERFSNVFTAFYLRGYEHGIQYYDTKNPNASMYQQVEFLRRKLIARRGQKIIKIT